MSHEDSQEGLAATAMSIKAPPFCSQDPSLWFCLLECNFKASRISSSLTKFNHAVSFLPPEVLSQVSAVISTAASSDTPYENLKTALLTSLQSSIATRLRELLSKEELGDEKPSQLLSRMKQLLGDKYHAFDAELFKQLFYQRLPPAIQRSLFSVKDTLDPDAIAKLADDFLATLPPTSHVSSVTTTHSDTQLTHLTQLISQLTTEVIFLKKQLQGGHRSRSSTPQRRQHRSRSWSQGQCWYHNKFGAKANKCLSPCTYNTSNTNGEQ